MSNFMSNSMSQLVSNSRRHEPYSNYNTTHKAIHKLMNHISRIYMCTELKTMLLSIVQRLQTYLHEMFMKVCELQQSFTKVFAKDRICQHEFLKLW